MLKTTSALIKNTWDIYNNKLDLAYNNIANVFGENKLVFIDRLGSFGRNVYSGDVRISVCKPYLSVSYYSNWGVDTPLNLSLENITHTRNKTDKHRFVSYLQQYLLNYLSNSSSFTSVIAWHGNELLHSIATQIKNCELIATPQSVNLVLEDKYKLNEYLIESGMDSSFIIPSINIEGINKPSFTSLVKKFGLPFVAQSNSSGGRGTFFINNENEYNNIEIFSNILKISKFIQGFSSNTTVLSVPNDSGGCSIYVDVPSHKSVGVTDVGILPAKGAGNDWSISFPKIHLKKFIESIVLLGKWAFKKHGLVGIWGIDSIWNNDGFFINEINCRLQGTTEVSSVNQIIRSEIPFLLSHFATLKHIRPTWLGKERDFNEETIWRGSTPNLLSPFYLKIRSTSDYPVVLRDGFKGSGLYSIESNNQLRHINEESHTLNADIDNNRILVANAPNQNIKCYPGSELCTLEGVTTHRQIFNGPDTLSEFGKKISQGAYNLFCPSLEG